MQHRTVGIPVRGGEQAAPRARAFSLIELLVVVFIIALLMAIMLPSMHRTFRQAASTVCMHNLKELNQAAYIYRVDNNGWIPIKQGEDSVTGAPRKTWFARLYPRYLADLSLLRCPDDPHANAADTFYHEEGIPPEQATMTSYGLSDFIQSTSDGYLANTERYQPRRPLETLMLADLGPDNTLIQWRPPDGAGAHRSSGLLPVDDSFDAGGAASSPPWLTVRHSGAINMVMLGGVVRRVPTQAMINRSVEDFYEPCAAGGCPLCIELHQPHYSFAHAHTFWWSGPLPQP